jgi:hypothetical protein
MESLAFSFPLRAGKTEEWRSWYSKVLGPLRSESEAFLRQLGLSVMRVYLQHTPHGDQAIYYLEGEDLQRTRQHLRTAQDPFTIWVRQRLQDFNGVDLTQTEPGSLSRYVFAWPSMQEDEASDRALQRMEELGMISP